MESDRLFDCNVKRRQLMGQTVYKSDTNTVLQSVIPPLPPLQRAPTQAPSSLPAPALSPPSTTDQEIRIIQGRTYSSKNLHAELTDTPGKSWILPTVYILLTQKDNPIYLDAFEALTSNCPALLPQVVMADLNRTNNPNNYCGSFNKTFSSVVGHAHPTIYNFLSAVHLEQASTEGKMHSYRRGVQPPKRKRRYLEKDTRLKHIVSTYHTYENNVAAYLDLLAQL